MKLNKFATFAVVVAVMAFGFVACNNDGKDIVVKETDYAEVFLNAFEEKLSLVFHTAERDLRRGNHDLELLFKNAYVEVLGGYADVNVFENAFWSASNMAYSVQARSRSLDEQLFVDLTHEIIDSSETKKEAIGSFYRLVNDVSLSLENRVGFITMREFLSFYENNESDIIYIIIENPEDFSEYEIELKWRQTWRCITGAAGTALIYGAGGCAGGIVAGVAVGKYFGKKGIIGGAIMGCEKLGRVAAFGGLLRGAANYCFD